MVQEAMGAIIPDTMTTVQVAGFNHAGDGGAGYYKRVSQQTLPYVGMGYYEYGTIPIPIISPSFASGVPNLVFATMSGNAHTVGNGPTTAPIAANSLAFIVVMDGLNNYPNGMPASYRDSANNTYLPAFEAHGTMALSCAIYYCANPNYAPVGTIFGTTPPGTPLATKSEFITVYSVAGFAGAVLDKTASNVVDNYNITNGSAPVSTTGGLSDSPEFCVGAFCVAHPYTLPGFYPTTVPSGWVNIAPPVAGYNVISCGVASSTANTTYSVTWGPAQYPGNPPSTTILVTFKKFNRPSLNPSYWELMPEWPVHTAHYGITPGAAQDNMLIF
jgi:hypothetical protein